MKKFICAFLICLSSSASAEFWDGNGLVRRLNEPAGYSNGAALGFIIGVHDTSENSLHCSPSNVNVGQVRSVVQQYLNEYPELLHNAAHILVIRALQRVWPCPKKGNPT